jgi:hypothetical protein
MYPIVKELADMLCRKSKYWPVDEQQLAVEPCLTVEGTAMFAVHGEVSGTRVVNVVIMNRPDMAWSLVRDAPGTYEVIKATIGDDTPICDWRN